jgi:hypothetical protein
MITNPFQRKVFDAVSAALPFAIDPAKITVEPGVSYLPSPIKLHDYAAGVMAALGSVVEHLGRVRGLPAQTMTLNRRLCGFHLNELQTQFLNGYPVLLDNWPVGADNGTYRTKDGRSSPPEFASPVRVLSDDFAQRWHGDGLAPAQPEMPPAQSVLRCDHTPLSHLATRPITPSSL